MMLSPPVHSWGVTEEEARHSQLCWTGGWTHTGQGVRLCLASSSVCQYKV